MSQHLDAPLNALKASIAGLLSNKSSLHEFVRKVDVEYGVLMHERPHFQQPGQDAHPDDEYTHEGVVLKLQQLVDTITV